MSKFIPLSVPNLKGNEIQYVTDAVETEWVSTAGSYVTEFEEAIANYVGTPGAVSCQSGTAGLHTAMLLCGIEQSDMVIVPALTFIAAVNPVKYIGAEPAFMDCDDSLCMDPIKLEKFCREECSIIDGILFHNTTKRRIPAIVVVHIFGNMADMDAIMTIADKYNLKVIEDATEALGTRYLEGKYKGKYAGAIGNVGVFSFNGNKIITTGGGGMLVSEDKDLLIHARHLTTQAKADPINYVHDEIGYNYRMTNLQAALGVAQLEQLDDFIRIKRENYHAYVNEMSDMVDMFLLEFRKNIEPNYWFYSLYVKDNSTRDQAEVIQYLSDNNVQSRPIWGLICDQKPYIGSVEYEIEKARDYWKHVVNLPCSTNLSLEDVNEICRLLHQ